MTIVRIHSLFALHRNNLNIRWVSGLKCRYQSIYLRCLVQKQRIVLESVCVCDQGTNSIHSIRERITQIMIMKMNLTFSPLKPHFLSSFVVVYIQEWTRQQPGCHYVPIEYPCHSYGLNLIMFRFVLPCLRHSPGCLSISFQRPYSTNAMFLLLLKSISLLTGAFQGCLAPFLVIVGWGSLGLWRFLSESSYVFPRFNSIGGCYGY